MFKKSNNEGGRSRSSSRGSRANAQGERRNSFSSKNNFRNNSEKKSEFNSRKDNFKRKENKKEEKSFGNKRANKNRDGRSRNSSRSNLRGGNRSGSRSRFGGKKRSVFNDITKFINKSNAKEIKEVEEVYIPENSFASLNIDERLKKNILESGYNTPTLIQDKSINSILDGRDLVGIANTGTGKTAAFLLPLIDKVLKNKKEMVIILAPTRELAVQINNEFKKFTKGLKLWSISAVGGMPIYNQIKDFRYEHNFVIGTPGRLKDLMNRGVLNIKEFSTIVLDESDRMLDMGFVDDMKLLMNEMPKPHQTLFFSATTNGGVNKIIQNFLVNPVFVEVKTRDTAATIEQDVVYINGKEKINVLHDLLLGDDLEKVIIFGETKMGVDRIEKNLKTLGHNAIAIHGDKRPRERNFALRSFKENKAKILIATDVAARGLDVPNVSHVINYDLPSTYEDYIHRIGRTGRGGKLGKAFTFVE